MEGALRAGYASPMNKRILTMSLTELLGRRGLYVVLAVCLMTLGVMAWQADGVVAFLP